MRAAVGQLWGKMWGKGETEAWCYEGHPEWNLAPPVMGHLHLGGDGVSLAVCTVLGASPNPCSHPTTASILVQLPHPALPFASHPSQPQQILRGRILPRAQLWLWVTVRGTEPFLQGDSAGSQRGLQGTGRLISNRLYLRDEQRRCGEGKEVSGLALLAEPWEKAARLGSMLPAARVEQKWEKNTEPCLVKN